ncbi:beta carbonic anhydrase 5, chloroplastic-like [Prosopis cineraria]|uniref:beta carbonic anhydrase 5, chloroplastic-like n=1 Tax=Prosopis cineraria TaxID=364024 RepID=UPI00240F200B|nr:beta carbonic anhydrase 5, chloroplastic-like [Prosopis cineraria]XP_054798472.1 beta carbonic anhydrase 5, chloroplastic-like [Prosopis cineraria]
MVWLTRDRSKTGTLVRSTLALVRSSVHGDSSRCLPFSTPNSFSLGFSGTMPRLNFAKRARSEAAFSPSIKENQPEVPNYLGFSQEYKGPSLGTTVETHDSKDFFGLMKHRFLIFKKQKYTIEFGHFQALAEAQSPKFMVIACADSRVCPSNILGFQPGDAFMIRNIANLVPPMKNGPTECNAALEFAVTILKVENILVIGHSNCAGIETLMNIQEDVESRSFIHRWVVNGKVAKDRTKAVTAHLSFGPQCRWCEKESIKQSLLNLLSYPWIEERVKKELLSLHGGYYDFSNCSFEKWTLDWRGSDVQDEQAERSYAVKDQEFWC